MTISYTNMLNTGGTANMRQSGANIAQYAAQMSSGNRITSASVDTASMSISTGLSSDAMTYHTYNQGLAEATSMIQVEDGGLQQVQSILDMLLAISTQATSGGLTSAERGFMNLEFQQLLQEMDRIANTTNFNGVYLLNGGQIETSTVTTPAPPANLPPQLNLPIPDQTATENIPYNYTIPTGTFTDPDNDFLTYMATLSGGAPLPGWLSFNAGTQTFSGTPPAGSAGTYDIEVTASDPMAQTAMDTFTLEVLPGGTLLNGTPGDDLIVGTAGADTVNALAGDDMIFAGDGDDVIDGATGTEIISAGTGDDFISLELNTGSIPASALPVTDNLVARLDAGNTADIAGHPGAVTSVNDQGAFNNDMTPYTGTVQSGVDTINGINALTFDGTSSLGINDTGDINTTNQTARSVFMAFETGADVTTRQVLYEQGGGTNGLNMYIENGSLYVGAWAGNGGTFSLYGSTPIAANSTNVAGFVFDSAGAGDFKGYLNGANFATLPNGSQMPSHTGDIGIGGANNATRFQSGNFGGNGEYFQGTVGEFLNYQDATNPAEANAIQTYLMNRFMVPVAQDTVEGGTGQDTVRFDTATANLTFDGASTFTGVENISLAGNHNDHNFVVDNGIFGAGSGVEGGTFTIDATGSNGNITVDATGVSTNQFDFVSGAGDSTITGSLNSNTRVSYRNEGATNVNLFTQTATGNGTDALLNVRNVEGSAGNDTLTGSGDSDTLSGGDGDDIIGDISIPAGAMPADNLVLYLDGTNTGDITGHPGNVTGINDQSTFNNDMSPVTGNPQSGVDTINGLNSITFDGNDILNVSDTASINLNAHPQRSLFVSFETSGDINTRQVIYEEGGTVNGFNVFIDNGNLYFGAYKNNGADFNIYHSTPIAPNSTYVGGMVFDFSGSGTFDAYVNGTQIGSAPVGLQQAAHSGDIGIGGMAQDSRFFDGSQSGNGLGFVGEVGEVLNYRDALNAGEITDLSNYLMNRRLNVSGGDDSLIGGNGNDTLTGGAGNDTIEGGFGNDRAIYEGNIADYNIIDNGNGTYTVTDTRPGSPEGTDLVSNVQTLEFADGTVALNVNNDPVLNPAGPFFVAEDAANGTFVGNMTATDPDLNNITYTITAGNADNIFSIDPNTGNITVGDNTNLDYETTNNYTLTIRATDDGPGALFDEQNVDIIITDINDTPPLPTTTTVTTVQDEVTFQASLNIRDTIAVKINDVRTSTLFSDGLPNVNTVADAQNARQTISTVADQVTAMRAGMGATQSRVDVASEIATTGMINTKEAKGKLADTDIAKLSTEYAREIVKYSAGALVKAQANKLHSGIIKFLFDDKG